MSFFHTLNVDYFRDLLSNRHNFQTQVHNFFLNKIQLDIKQCSNKIVVFLQIDKQEAILWMLLPWQRSAATVTGLSICVCQSDMMEYK